MSWRGYIPITKPSALSFEEFEAVLQDIGTDWAVDAQSDQPNDRPHWGTPTEDGTVFLQAEFVSEKITSPGVLEDVVAQAINRRYPKYERTAMKTALQGKVIPLEPAKGLEDSRQAALKLLVEKTRDEKPVDSKR